MKKKHICTQLKPAMEFYITSLQREYKSTQEKMTKYIMSTKNSKIGDNIQSYKQELAKIDRLLLEAFADYEYLKEQGFISQK